MKIVKNKVLTGIVVLVFIASTILGMTYFVASGTDALNKPSFKVKVTEVNPRTAVVGSDVTVMGMIEPQPFEAVVPEKEIVLVLDVSGSMAEKVNCANERLPQYCINHNSSECKLDGCDIVRKGTFTNKYWYCNIHHTKIYEDYFNKPDHCHDIKYDYCIEHQKSGEHIIESSTKIKELKNAAINFVKKMKEVQNLKIAIVAFSSEATINPNGKNGNKYVYVGGNSHEVPNYRTIGNKFLDINDARLEGMINGLEALGGTNTGEGLRKAQYLLDANKSNANKTIVLMSDGIPTFYSIDRNGKYMTIDNTNPSIAGPGSGDSPDSLTYATQIGETYIKKNFSNVFSIGYDLGDGSSTANKNLTQIHKSMGGLDKNFSASDAGAIDNVFNNIAEEIKSLYAINDVAMNISLDNADSIEIPGGSKINIGTVEYKTDGVVTNGRVKYTADSIPFSFIIKGKNAGDYDFTGNITVTFPWGEETVTSTEKFTGGIINFKDNNLPNIEAKLISPINETKQLGEEFTVTYEIVTNSFQYKDDAAKLVPKDVLFLIDSSLAMDSGKIQYIKQYVWSGLLNNYNNATKEKFGIISFNKEASLKATLGSSTSVSSVINSMTPSIIDERNVTKALDVAKNEFKTKGTANSDKYIILITGGDVTYDNNKVNEIKNLGYNILSLKVGKEDDIANKSSLKYLHSILEEKEDGYFYTIDNSDKVNDKFKDINDCLSVKRYTPYIFSDVKLNFNMGKEFQAIKGLNEFTKNSKYNYGIILNQIIYNANTGSDGSVTYSAKPFKVEFVIKANAQGKIKFQNPNTISYNKVLNNEIIEKGIITPAVYVQADFLHGVYKGSGSHEDGIKGPIIDENPYAFSKGSNVAFAGQLSAGNGVTNILLDVDDEISLEKNPQVYKILKDGSLSLVGEMQLQGNVMEKKYSYALNNTIGSGEGATNIIILYNGTLPNPEFPKYDKYHEKEYENILTVNNFSKTYKVKVKNEALPDLF